jgi:hypothetical protein
VVDHLGIAQRVDPLPGYRDGGVGALRGHVGGERHRVDRLAVAVGQGTPHRLADDEPVGWIRMARERGLLGPATPRKAGG